MKVDKIRQALYISFSLLSNVYLEMIKTQDSKQGYPVFISWWCDVPIWYKYARLSNDGWWHSWSWQPGESWIGIGAVTAPPHNIIPSRNNGINHTFGKSKWEPRIYTDIYNIHIISYSTNSKLKLAVLYMFFFLVNCHALY